MDGEGPGEKWGAGGQTGGKLLPQVVGAGDEVSGRRLARRKGREASAGSTGSKARGRQKPGSLWARRGTPQGQGGQGPALTCVTSSLGVTQVSPPAVKLQKTRKASRAQPWLGSTQYSPVKRGGAVIRAPGPCTQEALCPTRSPPMASTSCLHLPCPPGLCSTPEHSLPPFTFPHHFMPLPTPATPPCSTPRLAIGVSRSADTLTLAQFVVTGMHTCPCV